MEREMAEGLERLRAVIRTYGSTVTAFSAGIDSTLVAVVAQQVLGGRALAVTGDSESLAPAERADAESLARELGLNHRFLATREIEDERYANNPIDRCYFCKSHLYANLEVVAAEVGAAHVLNGLNVDDQGDWRPGAKAASEHTVVRSPLLEAGLNKDAIRGIAQALGIPNWDKPAMACLSSRVPYGQMVTAQKLARIGQAEAEVRALGFRQVRVRHFEDRARVEISPDELPRVEVEGLSVVIRERLLGLGFPDVEIDERGYRTGRLNEGVVPLAVV
jgi:uncharacterized protein